MIAIFDKETKTKKTSMGVIKNEGIFFSKKLSDKEYFVRNLKTSSKELIDIFEDGELVSSTFIAYKVGGRHDIYSYGDFSMYLEYLNYLNKIKSTSLNKETISEEILTPHGIRRKVVKEDILKGEFHELILVDKQVVSIKIKSPEHYLELDKPVFNAKEKIEKHKLLKYENKSIYVNKSAVLRSANIRSLTEISLEKDLTWLKGKDYRIIDTIEEVTELADEMMALNVPIAFDTETTGLVINDLPTTHPRRDDVVGLVFSWKDNQGIYIPFGHLQFSNVDKLETLKILKPVLETKHLVTHFGVFDWKVMFTYGIDINICDDTYILQYLIDVQQAKSIKKLKVLSKNLLGIDQIELEDFFPKKGRKRADINFGLLPYEAVKAYGPADGDLTRSIYKILRPKLEKSMYFIYGVELALMKKIARTEYHGISIDLQLLDKFDEKFKDEREELKKKIYDMVGFEFAISSPQQLGDVLFNKLGYPVLGFTKSNKPSTGMKVLKLLSKIKDDKGNVMYPVAKLIKDYRETDKVITAFTTKIKKDNIDGKLYPRYNQAGAESGRIAGYQPNLQQMDKDIRELFIPAEGYYMLDVDYSQVEYRVMAALAREFDVIEQFKDPDSDYHEMMASRMFNVPMDDVTSELRNDGKTLNFGVSFGMGDYSLAQNLFGNTEPASIRKAEQKRLEYFDSVPNIRDMFTNVKDLAELNGYVDTYFHRRRYIPNIHSTERKLKEEARRKAGNTRIQGTAADILKIAYNRLGEKILKKNLDIFIIGSIHDELLLMVSNKLNPWQVVRLIRETMELDIPGFPPLYTGCSVCRTWKDGKYDQFEIPIRLTDIKIREVNEGMHTEPVDNVFEHVNHEIREYTANLVKVYLENDLGLVFNDKINSSIVAGKIKKHNIRKAVKKYFKDSLLDILKYIYGEDRVYQDEVEATIKADMYDDESDLMVEILEEHDEILDDEIEGFGEEKVYIDEVALRRLKNKVEELEIKPKELIKTAQDQYRTESNVFFFSGKCIIKVDGIKKQNLNILKKYLSDNGKPSGYEVQLDFQGELINTPYIVTSIDRDYIDSLIFDSKTCMPQDKIG